MDIYIYIYQILIIYHVTTITISDVTTPLLHIIQLKCVDSLGARHVTLFLLYLSEELDTV